jgi:integrase
VARIDFALSPALRADARAAFLLLQGTDISLEEAARRAVRGRRALRRILVSVAADEFVRSRLLAGRRAWTVEWYEQKLKMFVAKFGARFFDEVDRSELHTWLNGLPVAIGTRAGIARAVRALWRWGLAQEPQLVAVDLTVGLKTTGPSNAGEAKFLTVPEVAQIMAAAGPYRSALALMLFGGVRPEEVAGWGKEPLRWRQVRVEDKVIRIPGEIAKTGKPRLIEELPAAVWAWLEPQGDGVAVCPARARQAILAAQRAIEGADWPHDATRHTFATYAMAAASDAGQVATWLGHEGVPTMLHRHYRGLTDKASAAQFWDLRPPS